MGQLKYFVFIVTVLYPFAVYWGLGNLESKYVFPLVLVVIGFRWFSSGFQDKKILIGILLGVFLIAAVWGSDMGLKSYPVLMNISFLCVFVMSLISPPTVIERFARLTNKKLTDKGVAYTRKVTWVWCAFFVINGLVSTGTVLWASNEQWLLYNGFVSYLAIGCLFVCEWLVRQRMLRG